MSFSTSHIFLTPSVLKVLANSHHWSELKSSNLENILTEYSERLVLQSHQSQHCVLEKKSDNVGTLGNSSWTNDNYSKRFILFAFWCSSQCLQQCRQFKYAYLNANRVNQVFSYGQISSAPAIKHDWINLLVVNGCPCLISKGDTWKLCL